MKKQVIIIISLILLLAIPSLAIIDLQLSKLKLPIDFPYPGYLDITFANVLLDTADYPPSGSSQDRLYFTSDQLMMGVCKANTSTGENLTFNYTWYVNGAIYSSGSISGLGNSTPINVANLT